MDKKSFEVDRSAFSVVSLEQQDNEERLYWRAKTPYERLLAVETTRQVLYGYDPASVRLQRVLEIAKRV